MLGCVGAVANDEENPAAESSPLIPQDEGLLDRSKIKRDFIIKVYAILAAQIALTAGLVAFLRSEVNSELNFPPNFEGLVLGCIDADFCK